MDAGFGNTDKFIDSNSLSEIGEVNHMSSQSSNPSRKRVLNVLYNVIIVILCAHFFGVALNIVWDSHVLHYIWGTPITTREFNVAHEFKSYDDPFNATVFFYFKTEEAFCAYNPIHVRVVVIGNRLNKSAVAGLVLQQARYVPDRLDVYGLLPITCVIDLHFPTDPNLTKLANDYPKVLSLEGEENVQWNLEGDYFYSIANGTKDVRIPEGIFHGTPVIHISPVDVMTQIKSNQRIEALTYALLGLSILAAQPIIKAIYKDISEHLLPIMKPWYERFSRYLSPRASKRGKPLSATSIDRQNECDSGRAKHSILFYLLRSFLQGLARPELQLFTYFDSVFSAT